MKKVYVYTFSDRLKKIYQEISLELGLDTASPLNMYCDYIFPAYVNKNKLIEEIIDSKIDIDDDHYSRFLEACIRRNVVRQDEFLTDAKHIYILMMRHARKIASVYDVCVFANIPHEGFDIVLAKAFEDINKKWFAPFQAPTQPRYFQIYTCSYQVLELGEKRPYSSYWSTGSKIFMTNMSQHLYKQHIKEYEGKRDKLNLYYYFDKIVNRLYEAVSFKPKLINHETSTKQEKKILFAFHYQPELTTSALALRFTDQLTLLENILRYIKSNNLSIMVLIKEHPVPSKAYRGKFFYDRLNWILEYYRDYVSIFSQEFINKCDAVVTLTGSIGFEYLGFNKMVLCSKNAYYADSELSFAIEDYEKFLDIVVSDTKISDSSFGKTLCKGVLDPDYVGYDYESIDLTLGVSRLMNIVQGQCE